MATEYFTVLQTVEMLSVIQWLQLWTNILRDDSCGKTNILSGSNVTVMRKPRHSVVLGVEASYFQQHRQVSRFIIQSALIATG